MLVNVHNVEGRNIISIVDNDLIGKEFEEGEKYLQISKHFYDGEDMEDKEILKLISSANSMNIVGKKSIKFCIKNNLIEESHILKVKTVPYAIVIFNEK